MGRYARAIGKKWASGTIDARVFADRDKSRVLHLYYPDYFQVGSFWAWRGSGYLCVAWQPLPGLFLDRGLRLAHNGPRYGEPEWKG